MGSPTICDDEDLIVFDGLCVFCSSFAQFVTRNDKKKRFRFVTAQSPTGRALYEKHNLDPDALETNIVIVNGAAFVKMQAFAAAMRAIGGAWAILAVSGMAPRPITDWLYDRIARNRYIFGRKSCPAPTPELRARLIE